MIKILVDSSADCNLQDGIADLLVPISVNIDGKEYRCGVDLTSDEFYELLQSAKEFPRTSQPSPQDFIEIFEKVKADDDRLIYFSLSSGLSGTYQCALMAKEMVDCDNIYIIDTLSVTHLIELMAAYARD